MCEEPLRYFEDGERVRVVSAGDYYGLTGAILLREGEWSYWVQIDDEADDEGVPCQTLFFDDELEHYCD